MSDSNEQELVVENPEGSESSETKSEEPEMDTGLTKALDTYRKLIEADELTEQQQSELEKKIKEIKGREIIEADAAHEPQEVSSDKDKIMIGPPVLTRRHELWELEHYSFL